MTEVYTSNNKHAASFMSPPTFGKYVFAWMAAHQIDFRKEFIDPWCKYDPTILAVDGTHVGVSVRHMTSTQDVSSPDTDEVREAVHTR